MVNSWIKNGERVVDKFDDNVLLTSELNASVAIQYDNYDEQKFPAHFWLWKTVVLYLIDDITVQLHKHL